MAKKAKPAFVPEAEQPYKIPQNWRWIRLSALVSPSKETTADFSSDIRYVGLEHMETGRGIVSYGNAESLKSLKNVFHDGQILYGKLRPYLNKHDIADFSGVCSTDILVFEQTACSCAQYVNYYFDLPYFFEYAVSHSRGIHLPRVTESILLNAACPLPPLAEQQRIVDRIESLFSKLDKIQERAQAALDSLESYRGAVLRAAFDRTLTAEWRQENGIDISSWRTKTLKECCKISSGGTPSRKKPEYYKGNIPWIKTGEIDWNEISDADERITESALEDSSAKLNPVGAVLVAMYGMGLTRGRAAILNVPAATNQAVCVLQPNSDVLNWYLFYYFMRNYWEIRAHAVGGNQLNLSGKIISQLQIDLPALDEQRKIADTLHSLLESAQAVKETAEAVSGQIELMKKAILGRAFRGELGTNDPSEESPEAMLRDLL